MSGSCKTPKANKLFCLTYIVIKAGLRVWTASMWNMDDFITGVKMQPVPHPL